MCWYVLMLPQNNGFIVDMALSNYPKTTGISWEHMLPALGGWGCTEIFWGQTPSCGLQSGCTKQKRKCKFASVKSNAVVNRCIYIYIWVNYNNSLTWIKTIWGWFPLLTMISSEGEQWGHYNLTRLAHHPTDFLVPTQWSTSAPHIITHIYIPYHIYIIYTYMWWSSMVLRYLKLRHLRCII